MDKGQTFQMFSTSSAEPTRDGTLWAIGALGILLALFFPEAALAHDVAEGDKAFVRSVDGPALLAFAYLGAKHMVTGYDHIAFLIGVVFFLRRMRDVLLYVSLFTLGHSTTLLAGVLLGVQVNPFVIDAIIGLSVVYKGVENIGGFENIDWKFNTKLAVLIFGLFHGLGLATKVLDLEMSENGLLANLIAFNIGVEIGQIIVLMLVVLLFSLWRDKPSFKRYSLAANIALIIVGIILTALQITGYFSS